MKRLKSKSVFFVILMILFTTVIGLTYGVFTVSSRKYDATSMLISNLLYGIEIKTTGGSEIINGKEVTLSSGNISTVLVKITSLNPIDSNYSLEYKITEGSGKVYYASNTGWMPTGTISKDGGLVYVKTVKVVIQAETNLKVNFNVSGGYSYDNNIISLVGYNKITEKYDSISNYIEQSNLKDIIEEETNCTEEPCTYGGSSINNYLQYPTNTNEEENIWRIIGTYNLDNMVAIKAVSNIRNTTSKDNIKTSLNTFYGTLPDKEDYIYTTDKFNCSETGCNTSSYTNIGLITTFEYNKIGGNNSYLANSNNFFSLNGEAIESITPSGIETEITGESGLRPTIYLQSDVNVTGSGTASDPYRLSTKGDIIIAKATLNGGSFPGKDDTYFPSESDPYIVSTVDCTNGTKGHWDEEKKTIVLTEPNLPTTCTVDFTGGYTLTMETEGGEISGANNIVVGRTGETTLSYTALPGYNSEEASITCDSATGSIDKTNKTIKISNVKSSQKCKLTIPKQVYKIKVTSTGNGTVTNGEQTAYYGDTVKVTLNPATGYKYSINTCGGSVTDNILTISNITDNKECTVTFTKKTYTVRVSAGSGGSITTSMPQNVSHGNSVTINFSTSSYYYYSSNTCGGSKNSGNSITISNVTENKNCSISFYYSDPTPYYTVTVSVTGGSSSPSSGSVREGSSETFTISADSGYTTTGATVSGTGCSLSGSTLTVSNVTSNITCKVILKAKTVCGSMCASVDESCYQACRNKGCNSGTSSSSGSCSYPYQSCKCS